MGSFLGVGADMNVDLKAEMLHPRLGESGLELCCHLSDMCDEELDEVMAAWGNNEEEVSISTWFTLSEALDSAIFLYEMPAYGNAIHAEDKPIFEAMRKELVSMIERIDALTFEEPKES